MVLDGRESLGFRCANLCSGSAQPAALLRTSEQFLIIHIFYEIFRMFIVIMSYYLDEYFYWNYIKMEKSI